MKNETKVSNKIGSGGNVLELMRGVKLSMFNKEDMQRVHDYSLQLLWENGINIANERALDLFKKHGFKVEGSQIYITERQVEDALDQIPNHFVLHGRNSERDLDLGGRRLWGVQSYWAGKYKNFG